MFWRGVYQRLGVSLKRCMFCMILSSFPLIFCVFCSVSDGKVKSSFSVRKSISTSEQRAEHLFAGRNTQHLAVTNQNNSCVSFAEILKWQHLPIQSPERWKFITSCLWVRNFWQNLIHQACLCSQGELCQKVNF